MRTTTAATTATSQTSTEDARVPITRAPAVPHSSSERSGNPEDFKVSARSDGVLKDISAIASTNIMDTSETPVEIKDITEDEIAETTTTTTTSSTTTTTTTVATSITPRLRKEPYEDTTGYCQPIRRRYLYWGPTKPGTVAVIPCPQVGYLNWQTSIPVFAKILFIIIIFYVLGLLWLGPFVVLSRWLLFSSVARFESVSLALARFAAQEIGRR